MANIYESMDWHVGEHEMHRLLRIPEQENPTTRGLTQQAATMLQVAPILALGTLDSESRPWTTLLGGESGFSRAIGGPVIGVRAEVDLYFDPVIEALVPRARRSEQAIRHDGDGKIVSGLAINLMTRKRVKVAGRMLAGALVTSETGEGREHIQPSVGEIQIAIRVEESLGNCPKYLNKKRVQPVSARPQLLFDSPKLSVDALKLISKADMFFISSSRANKDMDTNHRGGPPGFLRIMSNASDGAELIYPEYSGNRLYSTLGNLKVTPLAGITIPNFDTGDVLYATGRAAVLVGKDASDILPHTNLAVKIKLTTARFIKEGLAFRGIPNEFSPYNPKLRLLASESKNAAQSAESANSAILVAREDITSTISRYTFAIDKPTPYRPGQWVAMDFSEDLDIGYSHMREEDPSSLNDDYIRTFTVSSPPKKDSPKQVEFEVTIRRHGPVTDYLKRANAQAGLSFPLKGFGGDFIIETVGAVPFIAGGVGITPLLGQLDTLDVDKILLYWILRLDDMDFVQDVFNRNPGLSKNATVFLTGAATKSISSRINAQIQAITGSGAVIELRRPERSDFEMVDAEKWYMCAGNPLHATLLQWLDGKNVVYENFNY